MTSPVLRTRVLLPVLLMLTLALAAATPAAATQSSVRDGVWVGTEDGQWTHVALSIFGETVVFTDRHMVVVGTLKRPAGGADGDWDITVNRMVDRKGDNLLGRRAGPRRKTGPLTILASTRLEGDRLRICGTEPGSAAPRPTLQLAAPKIRAKGVRCFDFTNVTPPPAPPAPKLHECLSECRQQNQMRAVGPEVIEADCARICGASDRP